MTSPRPARRPPAPADATPATEPPAAPPPRAQLAERRRAPQQRIEAEPRRDRPLSAADLADLEDLLAQIAERFGERAAVKEWVGQLKVLAEVVDRRTRNAVRAGELVERSLVRTHVFGHLESLHRRLLEDAAQTIATRARACATLEESIYAVREELTSHIRLARKDVQKGLRAVQQELFDGDA